MGEERGTLINTRVNKIISKIKNDRFLSHYSSNSNVIITLRHIAFVDLSILYCVKETNMPAITIEKALRKYNSKYYKSSLDDNLLNDFWNVFTTYKRDIANAISNNESEEHLKNINNDFFKKIYKDSKYSINTDKRIDSSIKVDNQVQVIIETKKPSNKAEMITDKKINVKALHEVINYYLTETRDVSGTKVKRFPDVEIRRCIITDTQSWAIFDANSIEKIVDGYLEKLFFKYKNNQLIYSNNNDKFYKDIKEHLNQTAIDEALQYVYFDIADINDIKKAQKLYKLLSPAFLLKEKVNSLEFTHVLNDKFYQELLYLMGLKEKAGKSSKTIEIDHSLKNTLANQVYNTLKNDKEYDEIECVEKTFELIIIWINRLLFIKLFEGQLISFNGNDDCYHILDNNKISSFQDLQDLFFKILGKKEREDSVFINQFSSVPYLNSALFERYEIEKQELNINTIKNDKVSVKKNTVLGKKIPPALPILEYIISFLNCYDFSSEVSEDNTIVSGKDIIDSSVLGLIFEKLNGYRDGSFYTPSVITEYMCKRSIEKSVIDLINRNKKWNCKNLSDIRFNIGGSVEVAKEINDIINSIKICDTSVGSGHFLVSSLNRIIYIKKRLGVLFKYGTEELLTEYDIELIDDVLVVSDGQGNPFHYNKNDALSQITQETLFHEKRIIIENCLFGVDINAKAVAICQLRLWIELLKNAFYKKGVMKTLPNIDINIKSGNSLINKLSFKVGSTIKTTDLGIENNTKKLIREYKDLVNAYKETSDKDIKANILKKTGWIKNYLHSTRSQGTMVIDDNSTVVSLAFNSNNEAYKGAFEWAIEFPELLNDKGVFVGFDCIIGNPPYGLLNKKQNQNTSISVPSAVLDYYRDDPRYEYAHGGVINIFKLFIIRSFELLKPNGNCCLIFPMAFLCDAANSKIREFVMTKTSIDFIDAFPERDNENKRVFKEVKMSVCILGATKHSVSSSHQFPVRIHNDKFVDINNPSIHFNCDMANAIDAGSYLIPVVTPYELPLLNKISGDSTPLKKYADSYEGEVHMTADKKYMVSSDSYSRLIRGAQVQKYYVTDDISQGEVMYLDEEGYLSVHTGEKSLHHLRRRIVLQGITGINEKWRLKLTIVEPPCYCNNSIIYIIAPTNNDFDYYLLGILNSTLLNWYYAKLSTNSNVNTYGIDRLPIKIGSENQVEQIKALVKQQIYSPSQSIFQDIDEIVYNIYGIDSKDRLIISE